MWLKHHLVGTSKTLRLYDAKQTSTVNLSLDVKSKKDISTAELELR